MTQELTKQESLTPENLISQALASNVSVETIERLMAMRRELKAEFAKSEFDKAMANFQAECPIIKKKKAGGKTKTGIVAYHYAPIDQIVSEVKNLISKNGLSYTIKTEIHEQTVKSICIVRHVSGHSEQSEMEVPVGQKTEIMSMPQLFAAVSTFTKRYAFLNAFGIMTGDDDNEKNLKQAVKEPSLTVVEVLKKVRADKKENMDKWVKWLEKTAYSEVQKSVINKAITDKKNEA